MTTMLRAICLLLALSAASAFAPRHATGHTISRAPTLQASPLFEPIAGGVESYVNIWVPLFTGVKDIVPDAILKWGHGGAMATVLVAMGGIGAFLGYQIRVGNGEATYPVTLGKTAREQHPLIMSLMVFFFLLGESRNPAVGTPPHASKAGWSAAPWRRVFSPRPALTSPLPTHLPPTRRTGRPGAVGRPRGAHSGVPSRHQRISGYGLAGGAGAAAALL